MDARDVRGALATWRSQHEQAAITTLLKAMQQVAAQLHAGWHADYTQ